MAVVEVVIHDHNGNELDRFVVQPRTVDEQPIDLAHAIRDLISTVTQVTEQGD